MKKTIVKCPVCNTEFVIAQHEYTTTATVIGEDSGLGTIYLTPKVEGDDSSDTTPSASADGSSYAPVSSDCSAPNYPRSMGKLEQMRNLGLPVDNFIAVRNDEVGIDALMRKNDDGVAEVVSDESLESIIFEQIRQNGHVRNSRLFRRFVAGQVAHMEASEGGFLEALRSKGYEYSWGMLVHELEVLDKIRLCDRDSFQERRVFFTKELIVTMAEDWLAQFQKEIDSFKVRHCRRKPYKRIYGRNVFVSDIENNVIAPIKRAIDAIRHSTSKSILANVVAFDKIRQKTPRYTMSHEFENAYKAAGAYYTLKNYVMFHGVKMVDADDNFIDDTDAGLAYLKERSISDCENGEGYKLFGLMRSVLEKNKFDYFARMKQLGVIR